MDIRTPLCVRTLLTKTAREKEPLELRATIISTLLYVSSSGLEEVGLLWLR